MTGVCVSLWYLKGAVDIVLVGEPTDPALKAELGPRIVPGIMVKKKIVPLRN
jgi:hypothetical protein